jgi:tRNA A37 threonylcarbamoyladenosine synthetase subunit TsaC/SUA5/YrdC
VACLIDTGAGSESWEGPEEPDAVRRLACSKGLESSRPVIVHVNWDTAGDTRTAWDSEEQRARAAQPRSLTALRRSANVHRVVLARSAGRPRARPVKILSSASAG